LNDFLQALDRDLTDTFFNLEEFGELVTFTRGAVVVELPALFDRPFSDLSTAGGEISISENRPRVIVREIDVPGGEILSSDRFTIRGVLYKPVGDESNGLGVIRVWLNKVARP
jgi:hypothetical protein